MWRRWRSAAPLPIGVGVAYLGYLQYNHIQDRRAFERGDARPWSSMRVYLYTLLPLRTMSRMIGHLFDTTLPIAARRPVLGAYARVFGVRMDEAEVSDFDAYDSLGAFFRRPVRAAVRPISDTCLVRANRMRA
jgi:phosphatidylserine decarboxylase